MTAEPIARVVADLRAGLVRPPPIPRKWRNVPAEAEAAKRLHRLALDVAQNPGEIIDATAIYRSLVAKDDPVYVYEDHPCIAPPFSRSDFCYVNEHGNVIVMTSVATDRADGRQLVVDEAQLAAGRHLSQPPGWEPAEPVDWDRVRWIIDTFLWCGGRGESGPFATMGPLHCWRFAVYEDGEPADLHWVHLQPDYPLQNWDMAHLVLLGSLNFLACSNVTTVEPTRPRAERRRLERTGLRVTEIAVRPTGRASRGSSPGSGVAVPLHSVRGAFHHYGDCCPGRHQPKGLLFGRLAGRYWVPAHARGSVEAGAVEHSYKLVPH